MRFLTSLALIFLSLSACSNLPYQDDTGLLNSSQADSPEFPIYIDGHLCKDSLGNPGVCNKRIEFKDSVEFHIDPQPYAYDLKISCDSEITAPPSVSVPKNSALDFELQPPYALNNFTCFGDVFPQDRPQPLGSKWEIRLTLKDAPNPVTAFPVTVNQKDCHDMDNEAGFCSFRTASNVSVNFHIPAQQQNYNLTIACSEPVLPTIPGHEPVSAGSAIDFQVVEPYPIESFVCVGVLQFQDGSEQRFDSRVVVTDQKYTPREKIDFVTNNGNQYLVLGQYARDSWVFDGKNWSKHSKETMIKVDDPSVVKAYSESYEARFNYLNMDTPVEGN